MKKSFRKIIQELVLSGPTIDITKDIFSQIKNDPNFSGYINDSPQGSGLYFSFLKEIVAQLTPKIIVELGNREGASTTCIVDAMGPEQKFYTVDIKKNLSFLPEKWIGPNTVPIIGNCLSAEVICQIPDKIDFLFLDTEHTYWQVTNEWNSYKNKLADGAIVAVDDINFPGQDKYKFINDIGHYDWINEPKLHSTGFLVFQYRKNVS